MRDLSKMTDEERRAYWDKEKEAMRVKRYELDMLDGNIARLSVTDNKDEAYRQFYWVVRRAGVILKMTLDRISEEEESVDPKLNGGDA